VDLAWINSGRDIAYLTNRSGALSIWYIDLAAMTLNPLTQPLMALAVAPIGMASHGDRLVLPRHFVDSNIVLSDGTVVSDSTNIEFQPAASRDGTRIAYTVIDENEMKVWTAGLAGEKPMFRALGREPRFSANAFEIVYTHTGLTGNDDIWKLDIRDGSTERVTDAEEIDVSPDWSADAQSIAFASARGGVVSLWTIPASGGKRLRINDAGYAPRFSPDSETILFWNRQALWMSDAQGMNPREVARDIHEPTAAVWTRSREGPGFLVKPPGDGLAWPAFDVLPDGRFVLAPIDIQDAALWAIDVVYKEN
jgi:Tol biopolymer transport system component